MSRPTTITVTPTARIASTGMLGLESLKSTLDYHADTNYPVGPTRSRMNSSVGLSSATLLLDAAWSKNAPTHYAARRARVYEFISGRNHADPQGRFIPLSSLVT